MTILARNLNFGQKFLFIIQKWNFRSTTELSVKKSNFQSKIEFSVKNQTFSQKSNFRSRSNNPNPGSRFGRNREIFPINISGRRGRPLRVKILKLKNRDLPFMSFYRFLPKLVKKNLPNGYSSCVTTLESGNHRYQCEKM